MCEIAALGHMPTCPVLVVFNSVLKGHMTCNQGNTLCDVSFQNNCFIGLHMTHLVLVVALDTT